MDSKRNQRMGLIIGLAFVISMGRHANADYIFGTPTNLGPTVNSSGYEWYPSIRADGLEMYFESDRPGGEGTYDIWVSTRATKEDDWGAPTNLGAPINTPDWQNGPTISADGLELYYSDWGLCVTRRATVSDPWGEPENDSLININTSNVNSTPCVSSDGLSLFLASWNPWDLYVSTRPTRDDLWSEPVNLGPTVNGVNSSTSLNYCPNISADGLLLVFSSDRDGGSGGEDLWMTRRTTIDGPWSEPVNLGPTINSDRLEASPEISHDGRSLLFSSNRRDGRVGGVDIWQAEVHPVVDLNGDGIVDSADMRVMVEHWGEDYPLCDIGPTPFGDGIVDVQDLIVLAEHLFEEVNDPTLLAHWKLDEEEGKTAYDSVGTNDGVIIGLPQWRPEDGAVDGALELNGTTFVTANSVLSPADGPFSVLAWVKGGNPGQVVVSQTGRSNWLMANATTGALTTELSHAGQDGSSLGPEAVITDGNWHRIAFAWDGANARLHVDYLLVAEHTQDSLAGSSARLIFGTGKNRESGTYWSGLIDDIRIYNRAVSP